MFSGRVSSTTINLAQRTVGLLLQENRYGHSAMREIDPKAPFVCLLPELTGRGLVELTSAEFIRLAGAPKMRSTPEFTDYIEPNENPHYPI